MTSIRNTIEELKEILRLYGKKTEEYEDIELDFKKMFEVTYKDRSDKPFKINQLESEINLLEQGVFLGQLEKETMKTYLLGTFEPGNINAYIVPLGVTSALSTQIKRGIIDSRNGTNYETDSLRDAINILKSEQGYSYKLEKVSNILWEGTEYMLEDKKEIQAKSFFN